VELNLIATIERVNNMSELKALIKNRVKCCKKSGANGESKLWQSALDEIEELEAQIEFKIQECQVLVQACNRKSSLLTAPGKQLISEKAISYLHDQWPGAYEGFYERLD
jgi:hypothetical protein